MPEFITSFVDWLESGSTARLAFITAISTAILTSLISYFFQWLLKNKDHKHTEKLAKENNERAERLAKQSNEHAANLEKQTIERIEKRAALDAAEHMHTFALICCESIDDLHHEFQTYNETGGRQGFSKFRSPQFQVPTGVFMNSLPINFVDQIRQFSSRYLQQDTWIRGQLDYLDTIDAYELEDQRITLFGVLAWDMGNQFREEAGQERLPPQPIRYLLKQLIKIEEPVRTSPESYIPELSTYFKIVEAD